MSGAIAQLRTSWQAFCQELEKTGEIAFDPRLPSSALDRTAGLRQIWRNIALALQFEFENAAPIHPVLAHYFDPTRKQGGDNPDGLYLGAPINGHDQYRISGHRGSADYLVITSVEVGNTPFGGGIAGRLQGDEMSVGSDGRFEINIGPHECGPNWILTTPNSYRITIRQFFSDWEREMPMRAFIERVGGSGPRPVPTPEDLSTGLAHAGEWLKDSVRYWAEMLALWADRPGTFLAYSELEKNEVDSTPGGEPIIAYWKLESDEAMIVRVMPPKAARYWSVELGNGWWESMDYRDRLASTNRHYATLEEDGELILVVSHEDPDAPNWLDASGHAVGYLTFRWIGLPNSPRPTTQKLPLSEVPKVLEGKQRITPEKRLEQLAARRRGLQVRGLL